MFEDYKKEVLQFYFLKKTAHQLSNNLENPGRLKLKNECLKIFSERYTKKDDEVLKLFFDPFSKFNDHITSIEKFELDKFRPLVNFLQKGTSVRDDGSVKLLAWLTGFDSYQDWRLIKETGQPKEPTCLAPVEEKNDNPDASKETLFISNTDRVFVPDGIVVKSAKKTDAGKEKIPGTSGVLKGLFNKSIERHLSVKNIAILCIAFLLLGGGGFFLLEEKAIDPARQPLSDEKCMYWTGTHYEPVKCNEKIKNATIIPINYRALNHLRKINLIDTLTRYSLGKVWYAKINGRHEFFTDSGIHPVDTLKRLRPLSPYILSNHISYYRYLFSRLIWSACVVITVMLGMVAVVYFVRRQKKI